MNIRKWFVFLLAVILLLPMLMLPAAAADDPEFQYEIVVDGEDTVEVETGDIITVTLYLQRTDSEAPYTMYGMQSEIRYDSDFFELVEDSAILNNGIQSTDIGRPGGFREIYMNFVSLTGGAQWKERTRVGSFQLRVIGTAGVSTITNQDFLVSLPDGSGSYGCLSNDLTVILSTACTVKFETNGGTPMDPISAIYGETIARPKAPTREGKEFAGWFKDIHLTEKWNFETDTVKGNMTLYAKWADPSDDPTQPTGPETKLEITDGGITAVPENLKKAGLETVEEVKETLVQAIVKQNKKIDQKNVAHYDVTLMYTEDGGKTWIKADETHFPANGKLTVTIPYPAGTNSNYTFTVVHMFTSDAFGKTPGDVELPKVKNTKDGIQFEVTGLSPISVGWTAPATPGTGDTDLLMLMTAVLLVAACGVLVIVGKKKYAK